MMVIKKNRKYILLDSFKLTKAFCIKTLEQQSICVYLSYISWNLIYTNKILRSKCDQLPLISGFSIISSFSED